MAYRAQPLWVHYVCLGSDSKPLAGDLANHTVYWTADDVRAEATNNQDASNHKEFGNGLYGILLTDDETDCAGGGLDGASTTTGAAIVPLTRTFETGFPATIDGVTSEKFLKALLATMAGKVAITDNGDGTYTAVFKAQDGSDIALSVPYNPISGARATTATIP